MKRSIKVVLSVTLVAATTIAVDPVHASCVSPRLITSGSTYVFTPGCEISDCGALLTSVTDNVLGSFWTLGEGNPVVGVGIDNGGFEALGGWLYTYPGYPSLINTTWAASYLLDGCVDATLDPKRCMALLLNDISPLSGGGAFALVTDEPDALSNYDLSQPGNITLVSIPKPFITSSIRLGSDVEITVRGPSQADLEAGLHLDPACAEFSDGTPVNAIRGYRVYARHVETASPRPGPAVADWTAVTGVVPVGDPATLTIDCWDDNTIGYLAVGLAFESDFESAYVSRRSTSINCSTLLAEPDDRTPRSRRSLPRSKTRR